MAVSHRETPAAMLVRAGWSYSLPRQFEDYGQNAENWSWRPLSSRFGDALSPCGAGLDIVPNAGPSGGIRQVVREGGVNGVNDW